MTASHHDDSELGGTRVRQVLQISIVLWLTILFLALAAAKWLDYLP
jgi:hypothetical protein